MPVFNNALAGAAGSGGAPVFKIERSLRFNDDDSAYLSRDFSAGNRKTWTWSGWVKRANLGTNATLFSADASSTDFVTIRFESDTIRVDCQGDGQSRVQVTTSAVYRDPSAWYHIVIALDTTQSTPADRCKIYVNSVLQDTSNTLSQDKSFAVNSTVGHEIGRRSDGNDNYFDGYLADVYFIDGQALAPTDFGESDATTGMWNPKAYTGTYGTNGFHLLDFANESTIGNDSSGKNNDWTAYNLQSSDGPIYSSGVSTYLAAFNSSYNTASALFNGKIGMNDRIISGNTNGCGIKFVPSTAITGSIELYLRNGDTANSTFSYSLDNGSTFTNLTTSSSGSYVSIGNQTIGATNGIIVRHITTAGTNSVDWRAIRVNSAVLVDGNFGDVFRDAPMNADAASGNNIGNYATYNPLNLHNTADTLSEGNLKLTSSGSGLAHMGRGTIAMKSGKWYFEVTWDDTQHNFVGIVGQNDTGYNNSYIYLSNAKKSNSNGSSEGTSYGDTWGNGDVIGVAFDADNGTLTFYKNGVSQGTAFTGIATDGSAGTLFPYPQGYVAITGNWNFNAATSHINFGQRPFAISSIPTGFKSLCTQNLADPLIADGSDYFKTALWTGDGGSSVSVTTGFEPDFIWIKQLNKSYYHQLYDAVRGYGSGKALASNENVAEGYGSPAQYGYVSATTSTGFTGTAGTGTPLYVNENNTKYVAWTWDVGTSNAVSNTDGSGTTNVQVKANTSAGISIVTYTGGSSTPANSDSGDSFGHGLPVAPQVVICKKRTGSNSWPVYHASTSLGALVLDNYNGLDTSSYLFAKKHPSNSVVYLGNNPEINNSSDNYVAYCFAPVDGFSSFGLVEGNGLTNGPFIYTGFKPAFVMIKALYGYTAGSDIVANTSWIIYDNARSLYNANGAILAADRSNDEEDNNSDIDFLSNGFKLRNTRSINTTNDAIYMAFAEHPFKYSRAA